ncbi:MAG: catalase [Pseudobdellovibrionaceae bacterium]
MIRKSALLGVVAILLTGFFSEAGSERVYTFRGHQFPLHHLEVVPDDEISSIEATNEAFLKFFKLKYQNGTLPYTKTGAVPQMPGSLRGVHPKAHGCLVGTMKVSNDLEPIDQVGIFKSPGKEYQVMARFSNGSPHPERPDIAPDSRGFGLKVFGVEGEQLLKGITGSSSPATQEFTINSSDAFFADTAANYNRFMQIGLLETTDFEVAAKKFVFSLLGRFHPFLAARVTKAFQGIKAVEATNPLGIQYYSISAFQHGPGNDAPIVKYSAIPCKGTWQEPIDKNDPNFLKVNLKKHIENSPACFHFMVQHRTKDSLSVEDPTQPWSQSVAPFRIVAEINFPRQNLMDEMACERSVINPWNTLPEHKPVGGINRMRLGAYLLSIEARKKSNP